MEGTDNRDKNEFYSNSVRAGKRTYFFDVKSTRGNELYLTITESKKRFTEDGKFTYEKHKIFLYKEDFEKFMDALHQATDFVNTNSPEKEESLETATAESRSEFTNVNFEDLDK